MTTGRINQVARPPRRAGAGVRARLPAGAYAAPSAGATVVFPNGLCEARGTEVPRSYSVSGIRDQEHERGRLGDGSLDGRHHGATTRALASRRATPEGRARRRQPVRNTTSRGTGSSMQALVKGAGMVPARLRGRRRRESAAQRRGSSRQPRVHHNSCASVATTVLPMHPSARSTVGLRRGRAP